MQPSQSILYVVPFFLVHHPKSSPISPKKISRPKSIEASKGLEAMFQIKTPIKKNNKSQKCIVNMTLSTGIRIKKPPSKIKSKNKKIKTVKRCRKVKTGKGENKKDIKVKVVQEVK